jgi:hypothetical protein
MDAVQPPTAHHFERPMSKTSPLVIPAVDATETATGTSSR